MVIYWNGEDDAYVVEVPELTGCMADGRNYEGAVNNHLTVVRDWIETVNELDREVPTPKGRLICA